MIPESVNNNQSADEDDEFGGARLTKEMVYGKGLKTPTSDVAIALNESDVEVDDSDDEFGGARLTKELIYGKKSASPVASDESDVAIAEVEIVDDGIKLFSTRPKNNSYLVDREEGMRSTPDLIEGNHFAANVDTEFDAHSKDFALEQKTRMGLTSQIKGIHPDAPAKIYALTAQVNAGRALHNSMNPNTPVPYLPMAESTFHILEYWRDMGFEAEVTPCSSYECQDRPNFYVSLYGHLLLAEILLFSSGEMEQRILELLRAEHGQRIEMSRRIRCINPIKETELDYVDLNHILTLNGREWNLCLRLVDTCAVHGVAGYQDFCNAVGEKLLYKDNFSKDEKGDMVRMFIERFQDAENYSLGDLQVYEALEKYNQKWLEVNTLLGLENYHQEPKLTIGGTVKNLFVSALASSLEIPTDGEEPWTSLMTDVINEYIKPASANDLRQSPKHSRAILAKVEGGRCRNNRPTVTSIKAAIADLDIDGCYGEGQRNQDYFLGSPTIWDYESDEHNNQYVTLREWLSDHDVPIDRIIKGDWSDWGELVPGAWMARISTKEKLTYGQDFFASWFTTGGHGVDVMAKFIATLKADDEWDYTVQEEFNEDYGALKVFVHYIYNALLQHDGLEWIFRIASPRQRNEMLDKLIVLSSSVYSKYGQITGDDSPKSKLRRLGEARNSWTGVNTTRRIKVNGRKIMRRDADKCDAWFGINLGNLLIDQLIIQRKIAQKVYGKKSPLDLLFKLCINTLYGDMVSKFFITANPVVGNNITARARAMVWYMEKGLNGFQPITDGCGFELNDVLAPSRDPINGECINLHRADSKLAAWKIKKVPLGGNPITIKWVLMEYTVTKDEKIIVKKEYAPHLITCEVDLSPIVKGDVGEQKLEIPAIAWINKKAVEHLQDLFPKVSVLHKSSTKIDVEENADGKWVGIYTPRIGQFSFEVKNIYTKASFHGGANYAFANPNDQYIKEEDRTIKARAYNVKHTHWSVVGETVTYENGELDVFNLKQSKRYSKVNSPAKDLLLQLMFDPEHIVRQDVAYKNQILKPSEYRANYEKYDALEIHPGDNIKKCFLMQEFSLSQFTFNDHKQYMMWQKCVEKGKLKNKQSIEGYFLNEDGTLNFKLMIETVDEMIARDVLDPIRELDKNRNRQRKAKNSNGGQHKGIPVAITHPNYGVWLATRDRLSEVSEWEESDTDCE